MIWAWMLWACIRPEHQAPLQVDTGTPGPSSTQPLAPPRLLRRISLDLRGTLPTEAELDRVAADPTTVAALTQDWLAAPALEAALVQLLSDQWHTQVDAFEITAQDYDLDPESEYAFERAVGQEPLRLMARVVVQDRHWGEVVTAPTTAANPLLGAIWPIALPTSAAGWQEAVYTDGRPAAGVLATNGLWWRYTTDTSNMNRKRAAAISRLLLCEDLLARPVAFSAATTDLSDTEAAVKNDDACLACHATLDPLAANLFGFWWLSQYNVDEQTRYHPERELLYERWLEVEPAWFGTPVTGLADLGQAIAADRRLYQCATERFATALWARPPTPAEHPLLASLTQDFLTGGAQAKPLLAALMATPQYQAGAATPMTGTEDPNRLVRQLGPWQLAQSLEGLTGFRWTWEGYDQLDNDTIGMRVLAGGVDGSHTFAPQPDPGLTWSLVVQTLAEGAADHAVSQWLDADEGLLAGLDPAAAPGDADFDATLDDLHWRLFATPAPPEWAPGMGQLWSSIATEHDPEIAWQATLSAMFRDPLFVTR